MAENKDNGAWSAGLRRGSFVKKLADFRAEKGAKV